MKREKQKEVIFLVADNSLKGYISFVTSSSRSIKAITGDIKYFLQLNYPNKQKNVVDLKDYLIFNSKEEAKAFLDKDQRVNLVLGVKYKDFLPVEEKNLGYYKVLQNKLDYIFKEYKRATTTNQFTKGESAFFTCPVCKSSINREAYSKNAAAIPINCCPVCHKNMLSEANTKAIEKIKSRYISAQKEVADELARVESRRQPIIKWLVKID